MPRPKGSKNKVGTTELDVETGSGEDVGYDGTTCYHCGRLTDNPATTTAKGDRNQFKFCSQTCYNQDTM